MGRSRRKAINGGVGRDHGAKRGPARATNRETDKGANCGRSETD